MDKVVHFEIPADDMVRAEKFYADAFGWKTQKFPMPAGEYLMATTVPVDEKTRMPVAPGAINGGITKRDATTPAPIIVMDVAAVEEALKKIQAAGGTVIMSAQNIGCMGLYAKVKDTEGNVIGMWQNLPKQ